MVECNRIGQFCPVLSVRVCIQCATFAFNHYSVDASTPFAVDRFAGDGQLQHHPRRAHEWALVSLLRFMSHIRATDHRGSCCPGDGGGRAWGDSGLEGRGLGQGLLSVEDGERAVSGQAAVRNARVLGLSGPNGQGGMGSENEAK